MSIPVYLYGFCDGEVRHVDVADEQSRTDVLLAEVFRWGWNMFWPRSLPSVSVGDVVDLGDRGLWLVKNVGFREMTPGEFEEWKGLPRRERSFHAWIRG